ncbi:hypothetical protein BGX26_004979 [Mortierella sp. AD094]|nr:hypothetical protein BGX26_004979 [Mortierella sp. AD094]
MYTVAYIATHLGGTSFKDILAYAGVDWTPVYPNWGSERAKMPLEVIFVLNIIHPNGKELALSENIMIDISLAKHGQKAWKEAPIKSFYSSSITMLFWKEENSRQEHVVAIVNETSSSGIIEVRKNVKIKSSYQTWITSEEYLKLDVKSMSFVKKHHPDLVD